MAGAKRRADGAVKGATARGASAATGAEAHRPSPPGPSRLEVVDCAGLQRLPRWPPSLLELEVVGCPGLRALPSLLALGRLRMLIVRDCPTLGPWLTRMPQRLESVVLSGCPALTAIGDCVFSGCGALASLVLPAAGRLT